MNHHEQTDSTIIVGLGASAGGLEALSTFFTNAPTDAGIAYVVVTHQSSTRASLLPMLLARQTSMKLEEVTDGTRVLPDHVYVAPPGHNLSIHRHVLHLVESERNVATPLPINFFFRALAQDCGHRSIGIVLSGTGSDGTMGLREIAAAAGVGMVQTESDARFTGMPHSAIFGDSPDIVLPAAELPGRLLAYVARLRADQANTPQTAPSDVLQPVLSVLRHRTGHDFSAYKQSTVRRRIERRMHLHRLDSLQEYLKYLRTTHEEADLLFKELLIGVTSFFRDPAAFEALFVLFTEYMQTKPEGYDVRVWVAGCSTGEEAYSLAILLRECLESIERDVRVQIFATDLDARAIEQARSGVYPLAIAGDLTPKRLKRFFTQTEQGFQVRKEIRDMVVFATQNLVEDPPFTKLDLLSCRNLLIYLDADLQRRLFPIFHYVLRPNALLLLGASETMGAFTHLFDSLDKKWRISRRRDVVEGTYSAEIPATVPMDTTGVDVGRHAAPVRRSEAMTLQLAERLLLRELVPPTVIMRERGEILHIHGRTGLFLEPAPGLQGQANIFNMAREGLHLELAAAVRVATRQDTEVVRRNVMVQVNGQPVPMTLRVRRFSEPEMARGLFRVSFDTPFDPASDPAKAAETSEQVAMSPRLGELERALQYTKETLQGTIEEFETANEELKSTNEELQSTNEELQSANEELETSKEELQSLNEELQTVNIELQGKVEELSRANDDMTNLLNATDIAIIFLDDDLNIKRHNVQAKRVIRLIPSDVGRSIADLVSRLRYDQLIDDAREVLRTLTYKEVEVQGEAENKWYLMRILPYRTTDNVIDGLVLTFVDITRSKMLQQSEQQLENALLHAPVTIFGLDQHMQFIWACGPVFGVEAGSTVGTRFSDLFDQSYEGLSEVLTRAMRESTSVVQKMSLTVRGRPVHYELYVEPLDNESALRGATCVAVQLPHAG